MFIIMAGVFTISASGAPKIGEDEDMGEGEGTSWEKFGCIAASKMTIFIRF